MDAYKPSTPEVDGGRQISVRDQANLVYRVPSQLSQKRVQGQSQHKRTDGQPGLNKHVSKNKTKHIK